MVMHVAILTHWNTEFVSLEAVLILMVVTVQCSAPVIFALLWLGLAGRDG